MKKKKSEFKTCCPNLLFSDELKKIYPYLPENNSLFNTISSTEEFCKTDWSCSTGNRKVFTIYIVNKVINKFMYLNCKYVTKVKFYHYFQQRIFINRSIII